MPTGNDVRVRLSGINTVRRRRRDGSEVVYYYHRASGMPLAGEPGTPKFVDSYGAAERAMRERLKGTLSDLIRRFEDSPEFHAMAETTKREYGRKLKVVDRRWGSCPIGGLTDKEFRKDVLAWRDDIAKRARREADNLVSALARVLSYAVERVELEHNVLDKVKRVYRSDRSELIWLPEQVSAFLKVTSPELAAALMLAMHTGQRQADLLRLPWSAYNGKRITLRQSKSRRTVSIRCTRALRTMLEGMERVSPLILTTPTGRAWKKRYFSQCWQEASQQANILDLHFHDLRGTAITMLAEAGATVPEIASATGHSLQHVTRILEVYLARTRPLADGAIAKLDRHAKRLQKRS